MSSLRKANIDRLQGEVFDVLVIGAGINGAVAAACLAARGARVALVDRSDFASFTSQQSSNLAWGGIKYMESMEFALVRKLCRSRNHLIRSYPSTVQEIRFLATHDRGFRHGLWKLFLGTILYWIIGNFFTKGPRLLSAAQLEAEEPILATTRSDGGFAYSDAFLHDNDARFVWKFVRAALDRGCVATNYVEATAFSPGREGLSSVWTGVRDGQRAPVRARARGGERVRPLRRRAQRQGRADHRAPPRLLEGHPSHRGPLSKSRRVLTFFADDGRRSSSCPWGRGRIGTTDTRVDDPVTEVTDEDRRFVLDNINKRLDLERPLTRDDVIAERCGVRPLVVSSRPAKGESPSTGRSSPAST